MIPVPQPPSTATPSGCSKLVTYRDRLHPWCIVRLLPKMQRIIVARFRSRNEADAHRRILRQLIPQAVFAVLFDV
ncbi:MAG: hypothetical protein HC873_15370 [Leptolyngbyaceae cyanobacterium SL_1_1]|nr:hypothetical protein [Leptolyngbyaceae cyanobacterium RM1_1_2]NJO10796.1 hypothetical protein [Leptolyngbyaceae cyanobacterium SL_1_1]